MSLRIIFLLVFLCNSKSEDVTLMPKISGPETVIEGEFISYYCDYESEIETTSSSTLELVVTSRDDGVIDGDLSYLFIVKLSLSLSLSINQSHFISER